MDKYNIITHGLRNLRGQAQTIPNSMHMSDTDPNQKKQKHENKKEHPAKNLTPVQQMNGGLAHLCLSPVDMLFVYAKVRCRSIPKYV